MSVKTGASLIFTVRICESLVWNVSLCVFRFMCYVCFVIIRSSSLLLFFLSLGRVCTSWLWRILGIVNNIFMGPHVWSRRIDVDTTSFWCCVPTGYIYICVVFFFFVFFLFFFLFFFVLFFFFIRLIFEPALDKTYNKTCDQRRLSSACASVKSVQSIRWLHVPFRASGLSRGINENPCHTGRIFRLIWVFAGHIGHIAGSSCVFLNPRQQKNCRLLKAETK